MNHRITLLSRATGTNAAGRPINDWTDDATIWADVRFQSGAEAIRGGAESSIVKISVRIRTRPDVNGSMRIRYKGVEYDIKSVLPDNNDRQFAFLVCESFK